MTEGQEPSYEELKHRLEVAESALQALGKGQADTESRDRDERLSILFQKAADAIYVCKLDGRVVQVNEQACRSTGYTEEELLQLHVTDIDAETTSLEELRAFSQSLSPGDPVTIESRHRRKDGSTFPVEITIALIEIAGGPGVIAIARDITERKRSEEGLREREATLNKAQEVAQVGSFVWDLRDDSLEWSKHMFAIAGLNLETFCGNLQETIINMVHPDERASIQKQVAAMVEQKRTWPMEFRLVRPNGEVRWVRSGSRFTFDDDGNPIKCIGVHHDITEFRRAEEEIHESEAKFRTLVDHAPEALFLHELGSRIIDVNQAAVERYGYSRDELLQMKTSDIDPDYAEREDRGAFWREITKQKRIRFEACHQRKDGSVFPVEVSLSAIELGGKKRILALADDITERKQAEQALRESEKRVRAKLDAVLSPEGDFGNLELTDVIDIQAIQEIMDHFYNVTKIGVAVVDMKGDVLVATGWQDICTKFHRCHPETERNCRESDVALSAGVKPGEFKIYRCKNGMYDIATPIVLGERHLGNLFLGQFFYEDEPPDHRAFRAQARRYDFDEKAYMDALDRVPRWSREVVDSVMRFYSNFANMIASLSYGNLKLARSLDQQRMAEVEKKKLEQQFHQAQKLESIGRLAGGVAHDLNNLLAPILGYGEMLLEETIGNDPRREPVQEIVKAGVRARDLVRQLLAFSRKQTLEFQPVILNSLLNDFEKLLRRTIREDVAIHMALAPSLPLIQGDVGQLEQVIMNLAVNAQDAMPGGGELTIETALVDLEESDTVDEEGVTAGPYVMLALRDTGCGMDSETRERLFEPFFTTKAKDKGTGLGLATVYGIVKQHRGTVRVDSHPGIGSTFQVYLPVSEADGVKKQDGKRPALDLKGSETILLVEDNREVRNLAHAILKREGYTVLVAEDGNKAIEILERHEGPVNLLLTDVIMPEMDGKELYERVSAVCPDVKALYMSGYTDDVIAPHGVLEDGVQFIQKPFSVKYLATKVREVLDRS